MIALTVDMTRCTKGFLSSRMKEKTMRLAAAVILMQHIIKMGAIKPGLSEVYKLAIIPTGVDPLFTYQTVQKPMPCVSSRH